MARYAWHTAFVLALLTTATQADDSKFPILGGEPLQAGRTVWLGTCKNCHATGFASAPPVTKLSAWRMRLAKERSVLHEHAIEGFYGEDYAHMPPRGGNESLTDAEVMSAVDYMVALVKHLHNDELQKEK